ncbi:hypothetical protein SAMN05216275_11872 [Streptosporangium canum]|uniref:Uncharacterized protein n=1 Tax=Streptosporangium canum TaxID=324952 RepID=A0A1I3X6P9_9ACTN|nr:hypothetical protein [Streptosporangium canum]SFK14561.1 hypothetical protein SAMN05216275_11872 [Streptosporangium canum]
MRALVVLAPDEPGEPDWAEAHSIAEIEELVRAGRTVAVTPAALTGDGSEAAELAAASVCAWAGAWVFRTTRPAQVRLAVEMTESLAGRRPPELTRRGLA